METDLQKMLGHIFIVHCPTKQARGVGMCVCVWGLGGGGFRHT